MLCYLKAFMIKFVSMYPLVFLRILLSLFTNISALYKNTYEFSDCFRFSSEFDDPAVGDTLLL